MVEDSSGYQQCRFCNSTFSDEILKKIEDQKDDVYCESCGDIIIRVQNKYHFDPLDITENKPKRNIDDTQMIHQKELKPNPDALNFPIGRIFYDKDFSLTFKSNFVIVFSRQVCYAALRLEQKGEIELGCSEIPENVMNDLYMSTRHIQDRRINADFLTNLRKISKEEFENNLEKLQTKIQSNHQYLEDFHVYTRWLIRKVYLIITDGVSKNELLKIDLTIFRDLKVFFESELDNLTINHSKSNFEIQKSIIEYTGPISFNIKKLTVPVLKSRSIRGLTETAESIDNIWTDGRVSKGSVFGIIYLWKNKENGKIYWGRTEQRLFHYKGLVPISDRFYGYYKKARTYMKKDDSIYHHMHEAIGKHTDEQDGINAIFKVFELQVFEIVYSSGDFVSDCKRIEALEDWWINRTDSRNKTIGYNIRGGSIGSHTGHSKIDIDLGLLKRLMQSGYTQEQITNYFGVDRKTIFNRLKEGWPDTKGNWYLVVRKFVKPLLVKFIKSGMEQEEIMKQFSSPFTSNGYMSRSQLYNIFEDCFDGKHFEEMQQSFLSSIIDSLIEEGYRTPTEFADKLINMDNKRVWTFLVTHKVPYAVSLISDYISKGFVTTSTLAIELGLLSSTIELFLRKHMRGIRVEKLELYDKPRAWLHILESDTSEDLLFILGYTQKTIDTYRVRGKINSTLENLLGIPYELAKIQAAKSQSDKKSS